MAKKKFARKCTHCGAGMNEGYCIEGGEAYFCSDACLHMEITPAEWDELYADGEGESYWTDWSEDPDNFEDEDEDEDEVDTYHARDCSIPELTAEVEKLTKALHGVDEFCQQGLNSAEPVHWEAALHDIMGLVRAALQQEV